MLHMSVVPRHVLAKRTRRPAGSRRPAPRAEEEAFPSPISRIGTAEGQFGTTCETAPGRRGRPQRRSCPDRQAPAPGRRTIRQEVSRPEGRSLNHRVTAPIPVAGRIRGAADDRHPRRSQVGQGETQTGADLVARPFKARPIGMQIRKPRYSNQTSLFRQLSMTKRHR